MNFFTGGRQLKYEKGVRIFEILVMGYVDYLPRCHSLRTASIFMYVIFGLMKVLCQYFPHLS